MSKIRNQFSKRNIKISKELLVALEKAQLPEDILDRVINILTLLEESKRNETDSKEITFNLKPILTPEELLGNTYSRLDGLIERTEDMKSRVDLINLELQKLAYFG